MVCIYKNASASAPRDPLPGLCPWTPLGDCVPRASDWLCSASNIFPKFTPIKCGICQSTINSTITSADVCSVSKLHACNRLASTSFRRQLLGMLLVQRWRGSSCNVRLSDLMMSFLFFQTGMSRLRVGARTGSRCDLRHWSWSKKLAARVSGLPVGKNRMILGSLVFTHYETVTDRQTDKPPIPIVPL